MINGIAGINKFTNSPNKFAFFCFSLPQFLNFLVNTRGGKRDKAFENDPLIVAKPAVISKNKLQTVEEKVTKNVTEELIETPASG